MKEVAILSDYGREGRLNNNKGEVEDDDQDLLNAKSGERMSGREIGKSCGGHDHMLRGLRRRSFQLVPLLYSAMILLPIYVGLLSQLGLVRGVEGNAEIESCSFLARSSSSSGASASSAPSANGLYYTGSVQNNGVGAGASGSGGVGGNNNGLLLGVNNYEGAVASPLVDPHTTVLCHIRKLHPELDMENLTATLSTSSGGSGLIDMSLISRLKLECSDALVFDSSVAPNQLRGLGELHELSIVQCKLKHLPSEFLSGLRHLRKLTINTGNSDWAPRSLELSPGALSDVPQLRHLHLGFNHMWNIPEGLLCKLLSLQSLNLTHNLLSDIDDLGLPGKPALGSVKDTQFELTQSSTGDSSTTPGSTCLAELKSLDISFNSLRTLGSQRMKHLKRLQDLRLQHNWLEELEDDALTGLGQLRLLHLYSNRLVALPTRLFQPCKLLRELDLSNNSLTALSPGLLNGLEHLQILNLSMNALSSQWITAEAFKSLVRLVILNLSNNQLTHLAPSTFHDLYTLQVLDLGSNLISSIADGTFAPMSNLHSLNLARNRLVTINSNMFNGLYVLHKLILDYNEIESVQPGAMKNCTSLQDLSLIGNSLQDIPESLSGLKMLRTLDLGENKISNLRNDSFSGMGQLIGLRIVDNLIEEIPKGFCDSVSRLRVFNCAQNKIFKISTQAFTSCPELRVLRLDSNRLEEIPSTLSPQLPNLLWLNVSQNTIKKMDYTLLPPTLEWLDVSYNGLEYLGGAWSSFSASNYVSNSSGGGGGSPKSNFLRGNNLLLQKSGHQNNNNGHHHFADHPNGKLRVVDASHNHLTQLDHHAIPPHIEVFRLSHNQLSKIAPDTFGRTSNLRRVELIGNQLENIPLTAIRFPPVQAGKPLPEFFLGGNPFLCDCGLEWLTRINQLNSLRQHPVVLDLDAIICRLPFSRSITHVPFPEMKSEHFLCPYESHCFATCNCCNFACDCEMVCPPNCTCFHDDTWTANIVHCARTGHTEIPNRLPMDSTEVYLDGNTIKTLKSHTFIGRKNVRVLFLNSSSIETISNKSFNGLHSLMTLHLEENKLKVLHGYEFDHLTRLRELYLHNNVIESISNVTFLSLKSLEILRIDNNRLVFFTVWQLSLNPYLVEIGLAKNQWNCDCHFLHQLYGWVSDNSKKVVDMNQLQCYWNTTHKPGPHVMDYNRTCGSSWALMGIENGLDFTTLSPLPLALAFVSLVTLLILVVALVIICRENLNLWLFARFNGFRLCSSTDFDDDKSYDSYLIYSQKDEEFVAQRIADELETNDNYRLCLHYRDLICETGDLKEMMIGAVDNSKSVLIILSRNFLQGEWSSGEYRSAFHAVLKKSQRGGGLGAGKAPPKKILIVFIEDIPNVEINPDIRSWVRHNKIQVIKWNIHSTDYGKNRRFWNKLKFRLPDPSSHYHSNITSNTTTTSASSGDTHGGIMTTLKYAATLQNEHPHLHHTLTQSPHIQHPHHLPHHQIIVDEQGRFTTMSGGILPPSSQSQNNTLNSIKYWPYGATNFVALPPKYQPSHHSSSGNSNSSHPPSVNSPGSAQSLHYHPPLPLSNPPKSPPSSQSTDSTTTMADEAPSLMSQLTMASYHSNSGHHNISTTKSPVPAPKSRNNIVSNSNSTTSGGAGESYLSIEGEHVYSTLDPPSPQPIQQPMSLSQNILANNITTSSAISGNPPNFLNSIHLPNGYAYQQPNHHPNQQWHGGHHHQNHLSSNSHSQHPVGNGKHHHPALSSFNNSNSTPNGVASGGGGLKGFKKDANNPVQTYLV